MIGNGSAEFEGVFVSKSVTQMDERGKFVKLGSIPHFNKSLTSVALSFNPTVGTVRGIHFQIEPFSEEKSVSCIQGSVYDVIVDIRPKSKTFGEWRAYELTAENGLELFLPKGIAHGFQTLLPDSVVHYALSNIHSPEHAFAINPFGDLKILWPTEVSFVSERDLSGTTFSIAAQKYADTLQNI